MAEEDGMTEAEMGMMSFEEARSDNEPRNAGSFQKLEEKRKWILCGASRRNTALIHTLILASSESFWTSEPPEPYENMVLIC